MKRLAFFTAIIAATGVSALAQVTRVPAVSASAPDVPQVEVKPAPPPPTGAVSPISTKRAPASNITPAQLRNINQLYADLNTLRLPIPGAPASLQQRRQLIDTLDAAPNGPVRPSSASISRLGVALATVVPTLMLTPSQQRQLAIDVNMALNSDKLSPAEAERLVASTRSLLQMNYARNPQGVQSLVGELSELVGQTQGMLAQQNSQAAAQPGIAPSAQLPVQALNHPQVGQGAGAQTGQGSGTSASSASPLRQPTKAGTPAR